MCPPPAKECADHQSLEQEKGINLNWVISGLDSGFGIEGKQPRVWIGKVYAAQHQS